MINLINFIHNGHVNKKAQLELSYIFKEKSLTHS